MNMNMNIPPFVIKATVAASLGGVLFGYDLGIISAALPELTNTFDLSAQQQEMVVSFLYTGCCIGSMVGGFLCDKYGRKRTILWTDVLFILGAVVLYIADGLTVVLGGRLLVGCAVAISGIADVAYLHEISPSEYRGSIVSCNEACISLGFLISYITGYFMSTCMRIAQEDSWRYMFLLGCVIALVQFIAMAFMPESPIWLKQVGRSEEAKRALMCIYGGDYECKYVDMSTFEMYHHEDYSNSSRQSYESYPPSSSSHSSPSHSGMKSRHSTIMPHSPSTSSPSTSSMPNKWTALNSGPPSPSYAAFQIGESFSPTTRKTTTAATTSSQIATNTTSNKQIHSEYEDPNHHQHRHRHQLHPQSQSQSQSILQYTKQYYRQVIIALFLSTMQQFCGHPNVLNFAPSIFSQIGFNTKGGKLISTVLVGVAKFITTCVVIYKIESLGRRFLLLSGLTMIASSLLLLTVAYISEDADAAGDGDADVDADQGDDEVHVLLVEKIAATVGVFGVAIGYAMSFGPLTWLLVSEMFPSHIRGRALGGSTILTYLCASLVSYTFLSGQNHFGPSVPFAIYCALTVSSILFTFALIPDTAGKSPHAIHIELEKMWST